MRILFSPVGGSDPIKRMLDGPMLHCCRVYKPDIVCLYFTQSMLEYENRDQRYTWALEKLGEKLNHKFEIIKIEREDLVDVHKFYIFYNLKELHILRIRSWIASFYIFYNDFGKIFEEIEEKYPDAEFYVNTSSGTPAMKSAIVDLAALSEKRIKALQVSSGEAGPMHDRDKDETYDKEEQWECDMDNGDSFRNRTLLVDNEQFLANIKRQNVIKLISSYDYPAAKLLANEIKDYLTDDAMKLLNAAEGRWRLDYNCVANVLKDTEYDIIPVKKKEEREITEYLLWLGIILGKRDYLSFIRGITPAAMILLEKIVETLTEVGDIKKYCEKRKDTYWLTRNKLEQSEIGKEVLDVLDKRYGEFTDCIYTTAHLELIIKEFCSDDKIKSHYLKIIRKTETELRNPIAHTIVAVDNGMIKNRIGITAEELYNDVIKKVAESVRLMKKSTWNSYDEMNKLLIEKVREVK